MEGKLLESKLNSIFEKEHFGVKSNFNKTRTPSQNGNINPVANANGIFVSHYYLVLELEEEDQKSTSPIAQQKQDNTDALLDNSITVSAWLWILDMSAIAADEKLSYKVPLNLQPHNTISLIAPVSSLSATSALPNPVKLSANQGETTLSLVSSPVDPFQIAVHSSKQIFTGNIKEFISQLKNLKANSSIPPLKLLQVENLVGKYSPNIISIKFHKLSTQHLAILTDNGLFTVYNLSETRAYPEIQWNMQNIPKYGSSGEFYLEDTESSVTFVDFEFGGSPKLAAQQEQQHNNNLTYLSQDTATTASQSTTQGANSLISITDFDFLAVYFLTNSGKIFYQSPLILKQLPINRDSLQQFEQYLMSEIDLVQQYERNTQKMQALNEYLRILSVLEQRDYLESNSVLSNQTSSSYQLPLMNISRLEQIKIQLQYVEIIDGSQQDQQLQQSSRLTNKSNSSKLSKQSQLKQTTRSYSSLTKIETHGSGLHAFLVTKDGNLTHKSYATVQMLFSSLPAMPTHFIQQDFSLKLMKTEKARLQIQQTSQPSSIISGDALRGKTLNNPQIPVVLRPQLLSRIITQQTLDSICIAVSNRVYSINFAWTQQLLDSYLEDPNVLAPQNHNESSELGNHSHSRYRKSNTNSRQTSSVRTIVELKSSVQEKQMNFYAVSQYDKMIIMIIPSQLASNQASTQPQSFKLRCFSLAYLPEYKPIQDHAKILSDKFSQLLQAVAITQDSLVSKSMLQTVTQHERALETNQKTLEKLLQNPKISLKNFETEAKEFLNAHEQIIKRNIQLVYQRHAEATKAKEQLEEKKQEVETNILAVLTASRDQLEETQRKIVQNNSNIQNKLNDIAGIIQKLNVSQGNHAKNTTGIAREEEKPVKQGSYTASAVQGSQIAHALYERLLALKVQYQTYFSKRQTFLESIGSTGLDENTEKFAVNEYLKNAAELASKALRQHAQGLD